MIRRIAGGVLVATFVAVGLASVLAGPADDRREEIRDAADCVAVAMIVREENADYRASVEAGTPDELSAANVAAGRVRQRELGCRR